VSTTAAVKVAAPAVAERAQGRQPSRTRALLAATMIGTAVAVTAYKLLRNAPSSDTEDSEDESE
jgi:hypothetical protein